MSDLPSATHASVKHALLSTLSSSSLFAEVVIKGSLTQVKEDSQLKLLKNLSSSRGGKQSASPASFSGTRRASSTFGSSASSSSSQYAKYSSWNSRGSKCQSSSLLVRPGKVSFKGSPRSPAKKKDFRNRSLVPRPY